MKKGHNQKRKQEKVLKRRAKRAAAQNRSQQMVPSDERSHVRRARGYPLEGCWAQQGWEDDGLAVVVVARRQPDDGITFGCYLVDYYCLGLKDTFCNANKPTGQFHREQMPRIFRGHLPLEISPALAHELIYGAIEYSERFGFRPHRDFNLSQNILDPPDTYPRTAEVEFGREGKPFFVAGPTDDVRAVLSQLARTAGEGNFHFIVPAGEMRDDY